MSKQILIVDDSKALAESLADILRMEGYEVTVVNNGLLATSVLQKQTPNLIITDLVMPEMNGLDFIRELRKETKWSKLPVIAVSADTREERAAEGRKAGADYFFTKPFDENLLIEAIENLLK